MTPNGTLVTLHKFKLIDGAYPYSSVIEASDGNLYGTTNNGGTSATCSYRCGTVFRMTMQGQLQTLHSFNWTDGSNPQSPLVQGSDGDFYGTTFSGGADSTCYFSGCGTIFRVNPQGIVKTIYSFSATDGSNPQAALMQATDGNLYGTTTFGGSSCLPDGCGTVFRISLTGNLDTLYSFCSLANCDDGSGPIAGLIQAGDGNFYGTTYGGGTFQVGTIFEMNTAGLLTTLHSFSSTDGANLYGGLVQASNGNLYGTTSSGGPPEGECAYGCGTVFGLAFGFGECVIPAPVIGREGASVLILGSDLAGASSVTFNGVTVGFTVQSSNAIKTTVPTGATTGPVQVVTPSGTLTSNVSFQVLP